MIMDPHLNSFLWLFSQSFAFWDSIFIFSEILLHFFINHIKNKAKNIKAIIRIAVSISFKFSKTLGNYFSIRFLIGVYSIS
jgi:hypothetical protein